MTLPTTFTDKANVMMQMSDVFSILRCARCASSCEVTQMKKMALILE